MSQILNDFLGVLGLASSRLTPAKRAKKVLKGGLAKSLRSVPFPTHAAPPPVLLPTPSGRNGNRQICAKFQNPHSGPCPWPSGGLTAVHPRTLPGLVTWQPLCPQVSGISFRQLLTQRSKALKHVPLEPLGGMFCTINSPGSQRGFFISLLSSEDRGEPPCSGESLLFRARRKVLWRGQSVPNCALSRSLLPPLLRTSPHCARAPPRGASQSLALK